MTLQCLVNILLLDTLFLYSVKSFGLRGGKHRKICINNLPDVNNFEKNISKTLRGGITNKKRKVKNMSGVKCNCINCTLD